MRVVVLMLALLGGLPPLAADAAPRSLPQDPPARDTIFRHAQHEGLSCTECHRMTPAHGARVVQDLSDCRSCHHAQERAEGACADCHRSEDMLGVVHTIRRTFSFTVRDAAEEREVVFRHADHVDRDCGDCHEEGPALDVPDLDCGSCHEEHHAIDNDGCFVCHREPPDDAHPTAVVHQGCSGSGCHVDGPIRSPPRSRVECLWCHQEQVDHEPDGECVDCHKLSDPSEAVPADARARGRP